MVLEWDEHFQHLKFSYEQQGQLQAFSVLILLHNLNQSPELTHNSLDIEKILILHT